MKNPKLQKNISVIQSVLPNKAYIALGTNIGNWKNNFNQSFKVINKLGIIKKFSSFYLSYPYGYKDQHNFYNTAINLETNLEPRKLFDELQFIEKKLQKNIKHNYVFKVIRRQQESLVIY